MVQSRIRNAREGMLAEEEEAGLEDLHPAASELIRRIRRIRLRKQQHQPGTTVDADFGSLIKIGKPVLPPLQESIRGRPPSCRRRSSTTCTPAGRPCCPAATC